jgi:hypothetical protein
MASDIPMPRDLTPERPVSAYAPKHERPVLEALERQLVSSQPAPSTDPLDLIKALIKRLTHRQMHEVVREIFAAKDKLGRGEANKSLDASSIAKGELADVLDRFAYGD